jgi:hypothetical protein
LSASEDPLRPTSVHLGGGRSASRAALAIGAALVVLIALGLSDRLTPPAAEAPVAIFPSPSLTPAPTPSPVATDVPVELEITFGLGDTRRVPEILSPATRGSRLLGAHRFLVFLHRPAQHLHGSIRLRAAGESGPLSLELLEAEPSGIGTYAPLHSVGTWRLDFAQPLQDGEPARRILQVDSLGAFSRPGGDPSANQGMDVIVTLSGSESVPMIIIRLGTNEGPLGRLP